MPKVGDEEFNYTNEGIAAAQEKSEATGIPISDSMNRNVTEYAGGGKTGYSKIGMYEDGGKVPEKKKKKSRDDTLTPQGKAVAEAAGEIALGVARTPVELAKSILRRVKKTGDSVKKIKDSAYKVETGVKKGTNERVGIYKKTKLFEDKPKKKKKKKKDDRPAWVPRKKK